MIVFAMGARQPDSTKRWEPEPLELPIREPERRRRRQPERRDDRDSADDLPGSHVIVIDLA